MKVNKLAILASGGGTNAENLVQFFQNIPEVEVTLIASNRSSAFVLERATRLGVANWSFSKADLLNNTANFVERLKQAEIDYIILAGFLLKIPESLIHEFQGRIINIHPSLLPKYGGKGMYGHHVHEAVIAAGEKFSGITIHLVNEAYDEGKVLLQSRCKVESSDTPESLAKKIHSLEYRYFPEVIYDYIMEH